MRLLSSAPGGAGRGRAGRCLPLSCLPAPAEGSVLGALGPSRAEPLPCRPALCVLPSGADIETPTGVLVLEVVEAKHVPRMDFLSKSNPFVE